MCDYISRFTEVMLWWCTSAYTTQRCILHTRADNFLSFQHINGLNYSVWESLSYHATVHTLWYDNFISTLCTASFMYTLTLYTHICTCTLTHTCRQWPPRGSNAQGSTMVSQPTVSPSWGLWVPLSLEWAPASGGRWPWWVTWEIWGGSGRHGYQEALWVSIACHSDTTRVVVA